MVDTIGTQLAVLYKEVSLIHRWICTQPYVVGAAGSVLIREVSLFGVSSLDIASYPVSVSIPTFVQGGSRAWSHWGVKTVNLRYVTIHMTLDFEVSLPVVVAMAKSPTKGD